MLDGTVSRAGGSLEIKARLVNAGRCDLWTHTYDSAVADLPAFQNQIERDIAAQVHPRAYDLYLRGSYQIGRTTARGTDEAISPRPPLRPIPL